MRITILTIFPDMFSGFLSNSIVKRAIEKGLVTVEVIDFRANSLDKHHKVDDSAYGGAPGLVLAVQPLADTIRQVRTEGSKVFLMSPEGEKFSQPRARQLADGTISRLILVCGHYEGFDARIDKYIDGKISIGDYIMTGGEIPAMAVSDAVIRLLPGVIKEASSDDESFENGLLECPQYTMPEEYEGQRVPEVLLSGHHANIERWRLKESLRRTLKLRPDLLEKRELSPLEEMLLNEIRSEEEDQ